MFVLMFVFRAVIAALMIYVAVWLESKVMMAALLGICFVSIEALCYFVAKFVLPQIRAGLSIVEEMQLIADTVKRDIERERAFTREVTEAALRLKRYTPKPGPPRRD